VGLFARQSKSKSKSKKSKRRMNLSLPLAKKILSYNDLLPHCVLERAIVKETYSCLSSYFAVEADVVEVKEAGLREERVSSLLN
jgi:hypothetical protein